MEGHDRMIEIKRTTEAFKIRTSAYAREHVKNEAR